MEASHEDYPSINILIQKGQEIFENLGFAIFGDVAIMYDANLHQINQSKVIQALTKYKIAKLNNTITTEQITSLYNEIGNAQDTELDGITDLTRLTKFSSTTYLHEDILIWRALTLLKQNQRLEALETIKPLLSKQINIFSQAFLNFILKNTYH